MEKNYRNIAILLKDYPSFPKEYHYMIDEINFSVASPSKELGPAYYISGERDTITIHMIFNLQEIEYLKILLMAIIHELAHRIQAKKYPAKYDGEHGKLFKQICFQLGLDPEGEAQGLGERDYSKPFYAWRDEILETII
jgi:hypothetical protein